LTRVDCGAGALLGVFDIDSDLPDALDQIDVDGLSCVLALVFSRGL